MSFQIPGVPSGAISESHDVSTSDQTKSDLMTPGDFEKLSQTQSTSSIKVSEDLSYSSQWHNASNKC